MRSRALTLLSVLGAAAFLLWLCWFRVVDSDFWWHVKAGEILATTRQWIVLDPFAYTREGMPYVATHEWLAQIMLYAIFALGGALGIALLRWAAAASAFAALLSLDPRRLWPNVLLAAGAGLVIRQGLIERPQLFSNVLFAATLALCLRLLELEERRAQIRVCVTLVAIEVLWVNLHGGAALLAFIPLSAVFLQIAVRGIADRGERRRLVPIALVGAAMFAALFASPNHVHTFTYVWALLTDRTVQFIQEWSPHPWPQALLQLGPFAVAAAAALAATRRNAVAVGLILLVFAALARTASRHEVLFALACVGCTIYELRWNERWHRLLARARERAWIGWLATALVFVSLVALNLPYRSFLRYRNLTGIGAFAPAEGAADFVEANGIRGRIFNSYRIGGYLLYRGYPDRKVFVDGRNVDYGYAFLERALASRSDSATFRELEELYGFTVAVIEYTLLPGHARHDFTHLDANPAWALAFVDDWVAVYLKRVPENAAAIAQSGYGELAPADLARGEVPAGTGRERLLRLEESLKAAIERDPRGVRALLLLSRLYRSEGLLDAAFVLAEEAARRAPYRYEPYEIMGSVRATQGRWAEAAAFYRRMLRHGRPLGATFDLAKLAEVFERAGQ